MPFFGPTGHPGPFRLEMRVKDNEIIEAVWGIGLPSKSRREIRVLMLNALTLETRSFVLDLVGGCNAKSTG